MQPSALAALVASSSQRHRAHTALHQDQQHALLAAASTSLRPASPFALFAAQPSCDVWLKLLRDLQSQGDEEAVWEEAPHSILLTRRALSAARQQGMMVHRATIQQAG